MEDRGRFLSEFHARPRKFVAGSWHPNEAPVCPIGDVLTDVNKWQRAAGGKRGSVANKAGMGRASAAGIIILCSFVTTNWVTPAWTPSRYISRREHCRISIARDRCNLRSESRRNREKWHDYARNQTIGFDKIFDEYSEYFVSRIYRWN